MQRLEEEEKNRHHSEERLNFFLQNKTNIQTLVTRSLELVWLSLKTLAANFTKFQRTGFSVRCYLCWFVGARIYEGETVTYG